MNKTGNHNGGGTSNNNQQQQQPKKAPITWISQAKINKPNSPALYRCTPSVSVKRPGPFARPPAADRPPAPKSITLRPSFQRAL